MRKLVVSFLALCFLLLSAQTTEIFNVYINGLPVATSLNATDQFYVRQAGTSKQVPFSVLPQGTVTVTGIPTVGDCAKFGSAVSLIDGGTCAGTVSSVGLTAPSGGLIVSGSPITTSGTFALSWFGTIPNAQIPAPTASTLGGVETFTAPGGQFVNSLNASGQFGFATPAGGGNVSTSGGITVGNCAQWNSTTSLISTSAPCGSGGGGSGGFTDYVSIKSFGATGDGTCHALSTIYASLALAQAVYPFVSDLTQCVDWAATQQAINVAYSTAPANRSFTVYCPAGSYVMSNPIFLDQANNTQGSYTAWASGTTYNGGSIVSGEWIGDRVTYNGIPFMSMGNGNIGNPPTSMAQFPSQIELNNASWSGQGQMWSTVTVSGATITVLGGGVSSAISANQPLFFFTQKPSPTVTAPALPTGLSANTIYYVIGSSITATSFQVSTTPGGSAVTTTSAGVGNIFATGQVWQVTPVGMTAAYDGTQAANFSNRVSFIGDDGVPSNGGCNFKSNDNFSSPAVIIGPQNGNLIKNITLLGTGQGVPGDNGYKCAQPFTRTTGAQSTSPAGMQVGSVGFAVMSSPGGSSNTKFENTSATGFAVGHWFGYGTVGELVDSNSLEKVQVGNSCIGIFMGDTQAFINSIYDSRVANNQTGIFSAWQEGAKVHGGNWSNPMWLAADFAVTSVSAASGCRAYCITATITSPDGYLQQPECGYDAGEAYNSQVAYLNAWPFANGCGYNVFVLNVPHWGLVGTYVVNYQQSTGVITLAVPQSYTGIYETTCCGSDFAAQIAGVTTIHAVEANVTWFGQVQVDTNHIENDGAPGTLICTCTGFFGGARPAELRNVYMNAEASLGANACCNQINSSGPHFVGLKYVNGFYGQQTLPFINATQGDVIIDHLTGGGNVQFNNFNEDRVTIATGTASYVEGRHTMGANNFNLNSGSSANNGQAPLFDFMPIQIQGVFTQQPPLVNPTTKGQLSGGYYAMGGQAFGAGLWDNASQFGPSSQYASFNNTGNATELPSQWRTHGWGQTPMWGIRPAPWANGCVLNAQYTTLSGTLPSITYTSHLMDYLNFNSGGSGYVNGDNITLVGVGGTTTTPATARVTANTGGAITQAVLTNNGVFTAEPTSFTVTGGSGTGATINLPIWWVDYNVPYVTLFGGHIYHVCDFNGASGRGAGNYALMSTNTGYSYFQNLTTTNVPNLSWTMDGASPFIFMNLEALELMYPGLVFSLTGTGSCSGTESFIVLEVHPTMGYIKVVRADNDGTNYVPALAASGTSCTGTTIGQQTPNLINPY